MPIYNVEVYDEYKTIGMLIVIDTDHEGYDEHNLGVVLKATMERIDRKNLED